VQGAIGVGVLERLKGVGNLVCGAGCRIVEACGTVMDEAVGVLAVGVMEV